MPTKPIPVPAPAALPHVEAPRAPAMPDDPTERISLWLVSLPPRDAYPATKVGVYVQHDQVIDTLGGLQWSVWQSWNGQIKPWLAKRGAKGTLLAPGAPLEL